MIKVSAAYILVITLCIAIDNQYKNLRSYFDYLHNIFLDEDDMVFNQIE